MADDDDDNDSSHSTLTGFHCDQHENAADYFLDVITQCEQGREGATAAIAPFGTFSVCTPVTSTYHTLACTS